MKERDKESEPDGKWGPVWAQWGQEMVVKEWMIPRRG